MMEYDSTGASDALDGIGAKSARDPTVSQKVNPLRRSLSVGDGGGGGGGARSRKAGGGRSTP